jgi:D-xylose transport system permease protein
VLQVEIFAPGTWWNPWATLLIGLAAGGLIGLAQGSITAYLGVPSFIVTLAGLLIFRGIAWLITSGRTVAPMDATFQLLGGGFEGSIGAFGAGWWAPPRSLPPWSWFCASVPGGRASVSRSSRGRRRSRPWRCGRP